MDPARRAPEAAPASRLELCREATGEGARRVHPFVPVSHPGQFTFLQHRAIFYLSLGELVCRPLGYRAIDGTYTQTWVIEELMTLRLCTLKTFHPLNGTRVTLASITELGRTVADVLGPPGVFPLKAFLAGSQANPSEEGTVR